MPMEVIQGSKENAPQINECGWRAFEKDLLQKAMFPIAEDDLEGLQTLKKFRQERVAGRLSKRGCHTFIAIDKEVENGRRVLGYAVWYEEPVFETTTEEKKPSEKDGDKPEIPKSINIELVKRVENIIGASREDYLKGMEGNIWYLTMLGVDPEFGGRGIASELVKKGVDQAQEANLPAYTESTPAAVRVYANQGFQELGRKEVLEDGSYYFTAMLRMPKVSAAVGGST